MQADDRFDRRSWFGKLGVTLVGASGAVLALRGGGRLGIVSAQPAGAQAYRVNLGFVSAYIVSRGDKAVIIDSGVAGSAGRIDEVLRASGLDWPAVQALILTHHHADHAGSAADVFYYAPYAELYVGEADVERINTANLNRPVLATREDDIIQGLRVINTPGHTAGHICLLDEELGTIFTGDSITNQNNQLALSPPQNTADPVQARASVRKLGGLAFERAMFGHGEPIEGGAAAAFAAFGATLP